MKIGGDLNVENKRKPIVLHLHGHINKFTFLIIFHYLVTINHVRLVHWLSE